MIQPVIVEVRSQAEAVRRLVQHCKNLDGTEVKVVPLTPEDDAAFTPQYPECAKEARAAFSLHHAAVAMNRKPFIWMEHDSIPLKAGWVQALSDEYERLGKPFMLSSDSNPPYDLVGGIGVYSGDTDWMIPQHLKRDKFRHVGWDLWMIRNIAPLIARTPLIQHSYGNYDANGICTEHRFPRDAAILRKEAVIFHRDSRQTLLSCVDPVTVPTKLFYHSGDLGDVIYHLETIRRLGGGTLFFGSDLGLGPRLPSHCREPMSPARVNNLRPLLLSQPYIRGVEYNSGKPNPEWINLNKFRETFRPKKGPTCENLQRASLRRFGLSVQDETQPWLTVPSIGMDAGIVVARSARYHNDNFPWKEIAEAYRKIIRFVGLMEEWKTFVSEFGPVVFIKTENLLEVAQVVASNLFFIGNQSCPYAIAEGLKKPAVQESWPTEPNCVFQRPHLLNMTTDFERISKFIDGYL